MEWDKDQIAGRTLGLLPVRLQLELATEFRGSERIGVSIMCMSSLIGRQGSVSVSLDNIINH